MAEFVLMTIRLLIVFFRQTMTFMNHLYRCSPLRLVLAVALVASITLPGRASAQSRNKNDDKKSQGGGPRPPSAFASGVLPICYGRANGEPRLVRPWNVANLTTPTCEPPAPWNEFDVPAADWAADKCTIGGSFDCRRDEFYTQIDTSVAGPAGPAGKQGPPGIAGPQGPGGGAGQTGAIGPTGSSGPQGPIGPRGANGTQGPEGPAGPLGPQGLPGVQGPKGDRGLTGPRGADGTPGPAGPAGPQGLPGVQGPKGDEGTAGADGPQGPQGPTGATGPIGPTGGTGASGPAGPQGPGFTFRGPWETSTIYHANDVVTHGGSAYIARNGSVGVDPQGNDTAWTLFASRGEIGPAGTNGTNGLNGTNGIDGTNGTNGFGAVVVNIAPGSVGPCGPTGGAQVIGGDGLSVPVCNGQSGTTGQGVMLAMSRSSIALKTTDSTQVPDLLLVVPVSTSTAGIIISTDGGVQITSAAANLFAFVDIFLYVDIPATPTSPAIVGTQVGYRRVFVANALGQSAVANWAFSVVDVQAPGGPYTYRVVAKIASGSFTASGITVSGSSTSTPHLRGTLTAVGINK
jgi:hypothetical protein